MEIPPELILKIISYLKSSILIKNLVDDSGVTSAKNLRVVSKDFSYAYSSQYIYINVGGDFMRTVFTRLIMYNTHIGWNYLKLLHSYDVYRQLCSRNTYMHYFTKVNIFELMIEWFLSNPLKILENSLTEIEMHKYHNIMISTYIFVPSIICADFASLYPSVLSHEEIRLIGHEAALISISCKMVIEMSIEKKKLLYKNIINYPKDKIYIILDKPIYKENLKKKFDSSYSEIGYIKYLKNALKLQREKDEINKVNKHKSHIKIYRKSKIEKNRYKTSRRLF